MQPAACPTRAELNGFQAGHLEEGALAAVAAHVEFCAACQQALETLIGPSGDTVLAALLDKAPANPFAAGSAAKATLPISRLV